MSVDSKLFLTSKTKEKDIFKILASTEKAINSLLREERKIQNPDLPLIAPNENTDLSCTLEINPVSRAVNVLFKYKGEGRRIFITFDCDCDGVEITDGPYSTTFMIGHWGSHQKIMLSLASQLTQDHPEDDVFYQENDYSSDPAILITPGAL